MECPGDADVGNEQELRQRGLRTVLLSIHLANVHSLANKMNEIAASQQNKHRLLQICCTVPHETWLGEHKPDSSLHLPVFQLVHADRVMALLGKTRGHRICFYINEGWCTDVTV